MVDYRVPGHEAPVVTSNLLNAMQLPSTPGERYTVDLGPVLPVSIQGNYLFSVMADPDGNGNFYACLSEGTTDGDAGLRCIYACLDEVREAAMAGTVGGAGAGLELELTLRPQASKRFSASDRRSGMQRAVEKWNRPDADQMSRVKRGLDDLRATVARAVDKATERGERLEQILAQAEDIAEGAAAFNEGAQQARWKMWLRDQKWKCMVAGALAVLLLLVVAAAGGFSSDGEAGSSTSSDQHAMIGRYPGYAGPLSPAGRVDVEPAGSSAIRVSFNLSGLEPSVSGGLHIHSGTSCASASEVGGHYYDPRAVATDPWTTTYTSDGDGKAVGSFVVTTGYSAEEDNGHAVVVHAQDGSVRIGCGVLGHNHTAR
jgi:Cu/Zn superoxide dismutase